MTGEDATAGVNPAQRMLLSGNEAVALAARAAGVALGTGYPGTPATDILERFGALGGRAQWAPNEKVALEVALGAALGGAPVLVAMKHVGLNVAADPFFTAPYLGVEGPLVIVVGDDPGMASSQNEQDSRRYALAAGVPMFEPADSQESYDFTLAALELSLRFALPVMLRMTTRVCHSKTVLRPGRVAALPRTRGFSKDIPARVMIPSNARPAHRRLRAKLAEIARFNEHSAFNPVLEARPLADAGPELGIIASGVSTMHAREAAPGAVLLKLGLTHPLPLERIGGFVRSVRRSVVIEEGDPCLVEQIRAAGILVAGKPEVYRYGELNVARVRRILAGDASPEPQPPQGKLPALCPGCPHRIVYRALKRLECIVSGDVGCYSLGAMPPYEAMHTLVCMGAGIGMGLGLRHVLPEDQARRVVSVIGDSTLVHSGISGLIEMVYNPPPTGHVVLVLDNGTTAMTGLQEHPGTGRSLDGRPSAKVVYEDLARALGIANVVVLDPVREPDRLEPVIRQCLASQQLSLVIVRHPCRLAGGKIVQLAAADETSQRDPDRP